MDGGRRRTLARSRALVDSFVLRARARLTALPASPRSLSSPPLSTLLLSPPSFYPLVAAFVLLYRGRGPLQPLRATLPLPRLTPFSAQAADDVIPVWLHNPVPRRRHHRRCLQSKRVTQARCARGRGRERSRAAEQHTDGVLGGASRAAAAAAALRGAGKRRGWVGGRGSEKTKQGGGGKGGRERRAGERQGGRGAHVWVRARAKKQSKAELAGVGARAAQRGAKGAARRKMKLLPLLGEEGASTQKEQRSARKAAQRVEAERAKGGHGAAAPPAAAKRAGRSWLRRPPLSLSPALASPASRGPALSSSPPPPKHSSHHHLYLRSS